MSDEENSNFHNYPNKLIAATLLKLQLRPCAGGPAWRPLIGCVILLRAQWLPSSVLEAMNVICAEQGSCL